MAGQAIANKFRSYIQYSKMSVWTFIGSAPGPDTDIRPVSLEPAWPEGGPLENKFSEKWPIAKLPK